VSEKEILEEMMLSGGYGHCKGVKYGPVDKPGIVVTGHYRTVRHGELDEFYVIIPMGSEVIEEERATDSTVYYVKKGDKVWKIPIYWGSPEEPARAHVEEISLEEWERAKKRAEVIRKIPELPDLF